MAADADIVLNTAADPARAGAWLPDVVRVVDSGPGTLDVSWTPDGAVRRYEVHVRPTEHRLEWRPVDHDGWRGELLVTDKGAGSSEVELRVDTGGADVGPALDEALEGLAVEVDQNFSVG